VGVGRYRSLALAARSWLARGSFVDAWPQRFF
jgi:hypothetical protein